MELRINFRLNPFSLVIITNFLVFILAVALQLISPDFTNGSSGRTLTQIFVILGGMSLESLFSGHLWTLITANFLHIEIIHFILNMLALYTIGQKVILVYGEKKFFTTYITGGVASMLLTVFVSLLIGVNIATLGASGSIFALCGLLISGGLKNRRYGMDLPINIYDVMPMIIISLVYGFLPGSGVNNWAHIGGLLMGLILGLYFKHEIGEYKSKLDKTTERFVYYFSGFVFTLSYVLLIITSILLILG